MTHIAETCARCGHDRTMHDDGRKHCCWYEDTGGVSAVYCACIEFVANEREAVCANCGNRLVMTLDGDGGYCLKLGCDRYYRLQPFAPTPPTASAPPRDGDEMLRQHAERIAAQPDPEGQWRCRFVRSHGWPCNTLNEIDDESCGACGEPRPAPPREEGPRQQEQEGWTKQDQPQEPELSRDASLRRAATAYLTAHEAASVGPDASIAPGQKLSRDYWNAYDALVRAVDV